MKRSTLCLIIAVILIFISQVPAKAESSYVLPYPSSMPGSGLYKAHLVWEKILEFWYFGSLAQFEYNLKQSDKYLVEAKTLFDYKQYLLGFQALEKSNYYFIKVKPKLKIAESEGKNIEQKENLLNQARERHIEELELLFNNSLDIFIWSPEKSAQSTLKIHKLIRESIGIRENLL